jgi:hypothetical protein
MTRADLIGIMASATVAWRFSSADPSRSVTLHGHDAEMMTAALDAAEREGWRFVPPPEGEP